MNNHTELLLATPSMCQSRDLLIHVLESESNARNGAIDVIQCNSRGA